MHKGLQWRSRPEWDTGRRLGWHGEKGKYEDSAYSQTDSCCFILNHFKLLVA